MLLGILGRRNETIRETEKCCSECRMLVIKTFEILSKSRKQYTIQRSHDHSGKKKKKSIWFLLIIEYVNK